MKCHGQAMLEFAVVATVLTLLLLGLPVINRYHELQMATLQGARLLAFERSWRPAAGAAPEGRELQRDLLPPAASNDQLEPAAIEVRYTDGPPGGVAGRSEAAMLAPFRLTGRAAAGFDLQSAILQAADLRVPVRRPADLPEPFADLPVVLESRYALLPDSWMASGPGQVARRAGALASTHAAEAVRPLTALGRGLLAIVEPAYRDFCPGLLDPEQVPADRLVPGGGDQGLVVTTWRPSC